MFKLLDKFAHVVIFLITCGMLSFILWANAFYVDRVARTMGEVIASSRVQVIQSVDGGVISQINVREGDRVAEDQVIALLDQTRIGAAVKEIEARLSALKIKAIRLKAEVIESNELNFPDVLLSYTEIITVERALFKQRIRGFNSALETLQQGVSLATQELELVQAISLSGDAQASEILRAKKALNDAKSRLIDHQNTYFEDARTELAKIEDNIAQNEQVLTQRKQQLNDSVFIAKRAGIVKNVRVTTVGGVLKAGEELMQIIPLNDDLIIEVKISPVDISMVQVGQDAIIRFDPFDYTIYGSTLGEVIYVSADTLKEETSKGEEIYYRAHIKLQTSPITTSAGRVIEILPGMTAQVDIRSGQRSLLEYLLKPLRKTLAESFGER